MAKEFFKNLPDTSTPLSAKRLNGLLDGEESMGNIIVEDIACKNLFDKNNALKGYELSSATGGTTSNSAFYTSDYIEVIPGEKYYLTKSALGSSNCFYDSNKNFISVISLQTGVLTIPDNSSIKYVRFNGSLSDIDNVQFEIGEVATDYVEYKGYGYKSGSNENGNWIKYEDGTMICWRNNYTTTINITTAWGSILFTGEISDTINFPSSFLGTPTVQYTVIPTTATGFFQTCYNSPSITALGISRIGVSRPTSMSNVGAKVSYIAIGKWK